MTVTVLPSSYHTSVPLSPGALGSVQTMTLASERITSKPSEKETAMHGTSKDIEPTWRNVGIEAKEILRRRHIEEEYY